MNMTCNKCRRPLSFFTNLVCPSCHPGLAAQFKLSEGTARELFNEKQQPTQETERK